jgi:hypothetical protein
MRTPPVFWPQLVANKAGAHALAGKVAEGLVLLDDALELAAHGYITSSIPEFSMLKGDCALSPAPRTPTRHTGFEGRSTVPESKGLRMTQLRAALEFAASGEARAGTTPPARYARYTTPSPRASRRQT